MVILPCLNFFLVSGNYLTYVFLLSFVALLIRGFCK